MPQERQGHESGLRQAVLDRARAALGALEAARPRLDDLNVYPVPDGDTGTNLALSWRAVVDALEGSRAETREELAREVSRAALMGARGNSGVILSQVVRGAAASLAGSDDLARALRAASDAAYAGVRAPVEGTMLTAIRELAEEAEAGGDLDAIVARGEACVERTRELLHVLREAGVVDAGAAGLVELVRGLAGRGPAPERAALAVTVRSLHRELSRYRYCTSFVVEGAALDAGALERALEPVGDSLLVVGDESALRVHVHTDDPERAVSIGRAGGAVEALDVVDMHEQIAARERRLARPACAAVAVAAGPGNRRLLESLGAVVVDGATSPSPGELLAAVEAGDALEAVLLPNGPEAVLAAEHAADHASKPVLVLATTSLPAGLSALVAFDPALPAAANLEAMAAAAAGVAAGAVEEHEGAWRAAADGATVAEAASFEEAARLLVEHLLAAPRSVLTLLAGERSPPLGGLLAELAAARPELEVEVHEGGQARPALLAAAE
ncbi:MAG TPA: DAK2 domain-containing protein [Gaiellaceae bacterium]|nr:DAK2 domain-containing protein [Gaiellaceae bacterium]